MKASSAAQEERPTGLKLDNSLIREIGQTHPRFATMLASINKVGGLKDWMQVHQIAAPIYAAEVENWLKPEKESEAFFREHIKRRVLDAETPVYEFTLQVVDSEHSVLQGKVVSGFGGDPAGTNLEIVFARGKVVNWKVY